MITVIVRFEDKQHCSEQWAIVSYAPTTGDIELPTRLITMRAGEARQETLKDDTAVWSLVKRGGHMLRPHEMASLVEDNLPVAAFLFSKERITALNEVNAPPLDRDRHSAAFIEAVKKMTSKQQPKVLSRTCAAFHL